MKTHYHCLNLDEEKMVHLMKGGKLEMDLGTFEESATIHKVNIYPPHHGAILTNAEIKELKRMAAAAGSKEMVNFLFKKLKWGD